mmetsp:Transcript_1721/g.2237  ORF Transcript_1721/g.2237 Transcript_1721/m.2237 type:complete len:250 (+) Transcript_1721:25-774(+)
MKSFAVAALLGSTVAFEAISQEESQFMNFVSKFGRSYGTKEEYNFRLKLFSNTVKRLDAINANPKNHFKVEINTFADWTTEERKMLTGYVPSTTPSKNPIADLPTDDLPEHVDWVKAGAVTDIKDQGKCGSCWAFSTTGCLEGANFVENNELISLSEQQFVDCSWMNMGCKGGSMDNAFKFGEKHKIDTEASYPYRAHGSLLRCKQKKEKGVIKVTNYTDVKAQDEKALMAAVAQQPVSVAVEADQDAW